MSGSAALMLKSHQFLVKSTLEAVLIWIRCLTAAVFGLLLFATNGSAQNLAVTGRVADSQGGVVVNASVTLSGAAGARPVTVRTNADGAFTFASIAAGRYTVLVESPGFMPWMQQVVVDASTAPVVATLQVA